MRPSPSPIERARGAWETVRPDSTAHRIAILVSILAGIAVFIIAVTVFPYHSSNHDEAVYLFQAAMLLDGQLMIDAGELAGAFRPWFFVEDGGELYSRYGPVPAAMYAITMGLFGEPRVTLAAVAVGNTYLMYRLGAIVFDQRTGCVAATLFAVSPFALITTATFLPYAPTTFLSLLFAVLYLRSVRDRSVPAAAGAGTAIGLAFFARPYTALLFALPFIGHACLRMLTAREDARLTTIVTHAATAMVGLAFVGLTMAYNATLTGDPLTFPFTAFAPLDGPGFGHRELLGHSIEYTPALGLEGTAAALEYLSTRWFTLGPLGTLLALVGVWLWLGRTDRIPGTDRPDDYWMVRTGGGVLAGLLATVTGGNLIFWGTVNMLGTIDDPTDGLVSQFGPVYHFDLLVPLSVFAALTLVVGWDRAVPRLRATLDTRLDDRTASSVLLSCGIAMVLCASLLTGVLVATPLERNAANTDRYETVYEPFEDESLSNALVFIPTPMGEWQHHPFQALRNDPSLEGEVVYALDRDPHENFAVIDRYRNRSLYRFTYRGDWFTDPADGQLRPRLEPISLRRNTSVNATTTVGVPARVEWATARLTTGDDVLTRNIESPNETLTTTWSMDTEGVHLANGTLPLEGVEVVTLTITLVQPDGATLTYRQEASVRAGPGAVEVIWPPVRTVCPLVMSCGTTGTYLPDYSEEHGAGIRFETTVEN